MLNSLFHNKILRGVWRKIFSYYPNTINWGGHLKIINNKLNEVKDINKNILIAPVVNSDQILTSLHSLLGMALKLKGAKVDCLVCDMVLPACTNSINAKVDEIDFHDNGPKLFCNSCYDCNHASLKNVDKNYLKLGKYLNNDDYKIAKKLTDDLDYKKIIDFKKNEVNIGEHVFAGTLRFYGKGELEFNENEIKTLKKYFLSALLTQKAIEKILDNKKYDCVVVDHGLYVPQGIISEVARLRKISTKVIWQGHKENSLLISDKITFHKSLISETEESWRNFNFDIEKEKKIMSYIEERSKGQSDWVSFNENPSFDLNNFKKKYGIKNKIISLMPSVAWDARIKFEHNIFKNQFEWIFFTIDKLKNNKNLDIIIRVHPAEIRSDVPSAQRVRDEILKKYGLLPKNIKIIDADDNFSSYKLAEFSEIVIVYSSKVSFEVPAYLGKNTIVCGEAFSKNKGFTLDPRSKDEYLSLLDSIEKLGKLSPEKIKLARKYAYHFFFRRCMKLNSLDKVENKYPPFELKKNFVENFLKGNDEGLNIACDAIINDKPAILDC